eukprot:scaffold30072_cov88-Skeletonema_marinoi.AAC.1
MQKYRLNAVRAARTAAESALQLSEGKTNSWNDILKMPEFKTKIQGLPQLPTIQRGLQPTVPIRERVSLREGKYPEGNLPGQILRSQQESTVTAYNYCAETT